MASIHQCVIVKVSLTSISPVIWILFKLAFEVANYQTGSMLRSFESTFCAGCLVGGSQEGCQCYWREVQRVWRDDMKGAANSRHAIRERPHVCTISGIRWGRGRGGGLAAVCGSYENCSVLKPGDCNTALPDIPQSWATYQTNTLFSSFVTLAETKHTQEARGFKSSWAGCLEQTDCIKWLIESPGVGMLLWHLQRFTDAGDSKDHVFFQIFTPWHR